MQHITISAVFSNIIQKAVEALTPLRFEHLVAIFFDGLWLIRVNVCCDKNDHGRHDDDDWHQLVGRANNVLS